MVGENSVKITGLNHCTGVYMFQVTIVTTGMAFSHFFTKNQSVLISFWHRFQTKVAVHLSLQHQVWCFLHLYPQQWSQVLGQVSWTGYELWALITILCFISFSVLRYFQETFLFYAQTRLSDTASGALLFLETPGLWNNPWSKNDPLKLSREKGLQGRNV